MSGNDFQVLYTNIDQLLNKRDDLLMKIADSSPDIILITEVIPKAQTNPIDEVRLNIPGFNVFLNFDPTLRNLGSSNCRGIAIYVSNTIVATEVSFDTQFNEHLWVSIPLLGNNQLRVGCIYRSPSTDLATSTKSLCDLLSVAATSCSHLLICGDFNYANINWTSNIGHTGDSHAQQFVDKLNDLFLYQHVNEPTRYRLNQTPNILDLVITNEEHMINDILYQSGLGLSDHICLQFKYSCYVERCNRLTPRFDLYRADFDKLNSLLSLVEWDEALRDLDINSAWNYFSSKFDSFVKECIPMSVPRNRKNLYINREAKSLKNKKNRLWKRYTRSQSQSDYRSYTQARNALRGLTRNLRKQFERQIANNIKVNPKAFWNYTRNRMKTRPSIGSIEGIDGKLYTSDKDKSNAFNKFFSSVFTAEDPSTAPSFHVDKSDDISLSSITIDPAIVHEKLNSLKSGKAPGPDGWPAEVFKQCSDHLCIPLSILFVKSLESGHLPQDWKTGFITPIYKKGNKTKVNNYRPVCLTSVVIKLFESIIRDTLTKYLYDNNLLSPNQHGFVPRRSCCTQLLHALNDWTLSLDEHLPTDVIYFDFSKAFDTVPHARLLLKLQAYGINGELLNWFKSFLTDRHQCVRVNGSLSCWERVRSGVPQGSVLGPLLFALYVNELPSLVSSKLLMFADDIKLYCTIRSPEDCLTLQSDIDVLFEWSNHWLLSFNVVKCKVLHIGNAPYIGNYRLDGIQLEIVEDIRDLGIQIDSKLKFHTHTDIVTKKAYRVLGLISKSFECKDSDVIVKLYTTLVRPIIEYNNILWGSSYILDNQKLEKVQRRATRMISSITHLPYLDRLRHLNLPSLQHRRRRGDLIYLYQLLKGTYDINNIFFTLSDSTTTRGHTKKLFKYRTNSYVRSNFYSNRVINDWNSLPQHIVDSPSVNDFKILLDSYFSNCLFDFV